MRDSVTISSTVAEEKISDSATISGTVAPEEKADVKARTPDVQKVESEYVLGWESLIDRVLIEWGRDLSQLGDPEEGILPPTKSAFCVALELAKTIKEKTLLPPPIGIVPDGDGGIAFKWEWGNQFISFNLDADGRGELLVFEESRLVERTSVD